LDNDGEGEEEGKEERCELERSVLSSLSSLLRLLLRTPILLPALSEGYHQTRMLTVPTPLLKESPIDRLSFESTPSRLL